MWQFSGETKSKTEMKELQPAWLVFQPSSELHTSKMPFSHITAESIYLAVHYTLW
jgi:hypothetical protein